ncbi:hypothetical protein FSP39_005791 [Pinctada imbricata]|uniref:N-acetylgalactosaminide beta-1,3-galactosyltransferase n=1 Tax=Pinctada imbricata TaxID=66713 RepID=A0AA88YTI3_PINIB|nr:hypothetical protein FSP39_005791 [Pinctada imbricata]
MTTPNNHKTKATAVRDTWAKRCNITLFMSTREDKSIPTIALPVKEGRADLWAKTKAAFLYIHAHYKSDADWFIKTDDDTYIIMENLRYFLHNQSLEIPAYHGRRLKPWVNQGFMSGGAGYVINSKALELLVTKGFTNTSMCNPHVSKDEDVELGKCFDNLNVKAGDSRDGLGRERFLSYTMEQHMVPGVIPAAYKAFFYYNEKELGARDPQCPGANEDISIGDKLGARDPQCPGANEDISIGDKLGARDPQCPGANEDISIGDKLGARDPQCPGANEDISIGDKLGARDPQCPGANEDISIGDKLGARDPQCPGANEDISIGDKLGARDPQCPGANEDISIGDKLGARDPQCPGANEDISIGDKLGARDPQCPGANEDISIGDKLGARDPQCPGANEDISIGDSFCS